MTAKRILASLLVMVMIAAMLPTVAFAAASDIKCDIVLQEGTQGGREGVRVDFRIQTGAIKIATANLVFTYDTSIFEIVDLSGNTLSFPAASPYELTAAQITTNDAFEDENITLVRENSGNKAQVAVLRNTNTELAFPSATSLGTCFLAYKAGKSKADVTNQALRLATYEEATRLGQTDVLYVCDENLNEFEYGTDGGTSNTAGWDNNLSFGKDFAFSKFTLTGTPTISGNAAVEQTLTADVSALNDSVNITYQWAADGSDISGAASSAYQLTANEAGKRITVKVSAAPASNYSGTVISAPTAAVENAAQAAPKINAGDIAKTHNRITVTANAAWEYSKDGGSTWQGSNVFDGLPANTSFQICVRLAARTGYNASPASSALTVTTDKAPVGTPIAPAVADKTDASITVTAVSGQKYCIKEAGEAAPAAGAADWTDTVVFNGLERNTAYKIYTYIPESASTDASTIVYTDVTTNKTTITDTMVPVSNLTGEIYSAAVQEPGFGGSLRKGTDYTVSYSVKNNENGALDNGKPMGAGTYVVTVTGTGDYTGSFTKAFMIGKKEVTITPNKSQSKIYGESDPEMTYTTGLTGDLETAFHAAKRGGLSRAGGEDIGDYAISLGTLTAGNNFDVKLSAAPVNFSINVRNVTENRAAAAQSIVAGVGTFTQPTFGAVTGTLAYSYDGAAAYDAIVTKLKALPADATGTITYTYTAGGNYTGTISGSIDFTVVDIAFDIAPDAITVADNPTYGDMWSQIVSIDATKITAKVGASTCADPTYALVNSTEKPESGSQTYTITFSGDIAGNTYTNVTVKSADVSIKRKTLTANDLEFAGSTPITKPYDGNTEATAAVRIKDSAKISIGDILPAVSGTCAYNSKDVLAANTVTFTSTASESAHYVLPAGLTATAAGKIQPKEITLIDGVSAVDRIYDGTVDVGMRADGEPVFRDLVFGESLRIDISTQGTVRSGDVGTDKTVTYTVVLVDAATGEGKASNYTLNSALPTVRVDIKKATPVVSANDINTTYTGAAPAIIGTAVSGSNSVAGTWSFKDTAPVNVADSDVSVAVVFTPEASGNYETAEDTISVIINKATPTGTPTYISINEAGKTLADTKLGIGSILPADGTIVWNDAEETSVTADTAYGWTYTPKDTANYNVLTGSLTPYVVHHSGGTVTPTTYSIGTAGSENGRIAISHKSASKGTTVIITVTPDKGYALDTLRVTDMYGRPIKLTEKDGKYIFTMPEGKVTVTANFRKIEANPFIDVNKGMWSYDDILYAYENDLMNGTSSTTFAPNLTTSRAMIVTILYRLEGEPAVTGTSSFRDVAKNAWYTNAVIWAEQNGIVKGYNNGSFGVNDNITREQLAAILYRYMQFKGMDAVTTSEHLISFSDHGKVSGYAVQAMNWAVANGLIQGADGKLMPADGATREQLAAILHRFCENVRK